MNGVRIGVVGATGAVGRELLSILDERGFNFSELRLFASERSKGEEIEVAGHHYKVDTLSPKALSGLDIVFFTARSNISREYVPIAVKERAVAVDNSSCFRMNPQTILAVPEVNGQKLRATLRGHSFSEGLLIANPNCVAAPLSVVLSPLHQLGKLKRVVVSTYQSVSGRGQIGMDELWNQTSAIFNQQEIKESAFPHQIAFNLIPQIDEFGENGTTLEEDKIIKETRKITGIDGLPLTVTAVRVPVFCGHSASVNVEFINKTTPEQVRAALKESPGIIVLDDPAEKLYPLPVEVAGTDATFVGRIRADESVPSGVNLWFSADNLRKGAALNAVQIAEIVVQERFPTTES